MAACSAGTAGKAGVVDLKDPGWAAMVEMLYYRHTSKKSCSTGAGPSDKCKYSAHIHLFWLLFLFWLRVAGSHVRTQFWCGSAFSLEVSEQFSERRAAWHYYIIYVWPSFTLFGSCLFHCLIQTKISHSCRTTNKGRRTLLGKCFDNNKKKLKKKVL